MATTALNVVSKLLITYIFGEALASMSFVASKAALIQMPTA